MAQILTISSEICQAYKFAMADSKLRKQFNLETRVSLAAAARFTATDYLQVVIDLCSLYDANPYTDILATSVWHFKDWTHVSSCQTRSWNLSACTATSVAAVVIDCVEGLAAQLSVLRCLGVTGSEDQDAAHDALHAHLL